MKRLLVVLLIWISTFSVAEASDSSSTKVQIAGETTSICNLYYEVLYKGERIQEEIEFELMNKSGMVIDIIETTDGIVSKEKIPLGDYVLRVKEQDKNLL